MSVCRHLQSGLGRAPLLVLAILTILSAPTFGEVCDVDSDSDIDRLDLTAIFAARNQPASGVDDPRDEDANGYITVLDGRACALRCALAQCAVVDPPAIEITSPEGGTLFAGSPIVVSGTVDDENAAVDVNGIAATVNADGTFVATGVALQEGENA
ncbi:unnamed protein product, partial [marine sediment metagenome]